MTLPSAEGDAWSIPDCERSFDSSRRPCIRGTRVSVAVIVGYSGDLRVEALLKQFPHLTREGVRAAIQYSREG